VDFHVNEILHILKHSGSKLVFVSAQQYDKIGYSELDPFPVMVDMETFEPVEPHLPQGKVLDFIQERSRDINRLKRGLWKQWVCVSAEVHEEDLAAIIYTSGTTGSSKGVMLSHKNLVLDAHLTLKIQELNENDRLISILPLPHTYECTIGFLIPMMQGACVYYLDKPPTARILIPAMQKIRPTMI
jgi:long-chain acyl-CoA synthetase